MSTDPCCDLTKIVITGPTNMLSRESLCCKESHHIPLVLEKNSWQIKCMGVTLDTRRFQEQLPQDKAVLHEFVPKRWTRKKGTNPNVWVRMSSGGVGVFHVNTVGAKKFGMSLEASETKLFWLHIPGFCWDIPGAPERLLRKNVFYFGPE